MDLLIPLIFIAVIAYYLYLKRSNKKLARQRYSRKVYYDERFNNHNRVPYKDSNAVE